MELLDVFRDRIWPHT